MYSYFAFFIVYAFLGWVLEVVYAAVKSGKFVNRGFLLGPVCPIYGFGAVVVIVALAPVKDNKLVLFVCSVLLASGIELIGGWLLDKIFSQRWWDYSHRPFNIGGYVCLMFSLMWGVCCIFLVDYIHPVVVKMLTVLPRLLVVVMLAFAYAMLLVDTIVTVMHILKLNKQLKRLNAITQKIRKLSDSLGVQIAGYTIKTNEKVSELEQAIKGKADGELKSLLNEKKMLLAKKSVLVRHMLKAFPDWSHRKYLHESEEYKHEE